MNMLVEDEEFNITRKADEYVSERQGIQHNAKKAG
jgi:hypothetical protein